MKKNSTPSTPYKQSSDTMLDWSYMEMQEHDLLISEAQEFSYAFMEEKE